MIPAVPYVYAISAGNINCDMYDLRVIVALVVIHQLDIRTWTAQNCSESFIATFG